MVSHAELVQLLTKLAYEADSIYVRVEKDGRWQSLALVELEPNERAAWTVRFIERRFPGAAPWTLWAEYGSEITIPLRTE